METKPASLYFSSSWEGGTTEGGTEKEGEDDYEEGDIGLRQAKVATNVDPCQ